MNGFYSGICAKARDDLPSKLRSHDRAEWSVREDGDIARNA